jgi:hypothetical protein
MEMLDESARRWLASLEDRRKSTKPLGAMAPWDEFEWFDTPIELLVVLIAFTPTSVFKANVRRVMFMAAAPPGQNFFMSTLPNNGVNAGIQVQATTLPLIITQATHGPLCQMEWFATGPVNMNISTWEVLLRDWPQ